MQLICIICVINYQKSILNIAKQRTQLCSSKISRVEDIGFCLKSASLTSSVQTGNVNYSPSKVIYHTIYTKRTKDLQLHLIYSTYDLPSFALFGLTNDILIQTSKVSVKIPQQLNSAALICLQCDVNVSASDFAFVASGQNVSGFVLLLNSQMAVTQSLFQLRTLGVNAGGLLLNSTKAAISLESCNVSSFIEAILSGSLAVFVLDKISLTVNDVRLCSDAKHFGIGISNLSQIGSMVETCAVCEDSHYAYGLCLDNLEHGWVENDQITCAGSFLFDGDRCSCPNGQVLNGSSCVDILASVSIMLEKQEQAKLHVQNISNDVKELDSSTKMLLLDVQQIQLQTKELGKQFTAAQINLAENQLHIEQNLEQSLKQYFNNLQNNIQIIENRVLANTTEITNNIQDVNTSFNTFKSSLNSMNSTLQTQISQSLDLHLSINTISQDISTNSQIISQQQATLQNLSAQIQCMNNRTSDKNCPCHAIQATTQPSGLGAFSSALRGLNSFKAIALALKMQLWLVRRACARLHTQFYKAINVFVLYQILL
ncbi:Hypothetical_protein [Hexamita inflata]|uniref:Hypothetical_protein n=1 Tax=Hexamita inflata TaxID=28002 RepID=A0AA86RGR6_9EUKA|nr:Hypothetical protein HINF_LOCUS54460 [Hexamita inflata]